MFRCSTILGRLARLGRFGCAVAALALLALPGCTSLRPQDLDVSRANDFFSPVGDFRPARERRTTPQAVTNKGMQIARNLGVYD